MYPTCKIVYQYDTVYLSKFRAEGSSKEFPGEKFDSTDVELHSEIKRTQSLLDQAIQEEQAAKNRSHKLEASMKRRKQVYERYINTLYILKSLKLCLAAVRSCNACNHVCTTPEPPHILGQKTMCNH